MGGLQAIEQVREHFVDRQRVGELLFHAAVYLGARSIDRKAGLGADRKIADLLGIVAFVRPAHLELAKIQRVNDFGGAGNQRHDPKAHSLTVNRFTTWWPKTAS